MKLLRLFAVLVFAPHMLAAQTPEAAGPPAQHAAPALPPATGSVAGHVFLGDSHLPARMATVTLLPAGKAAEGAAKSATSTAQVQTGLDGAFLIPNILPGAYFVIAQKLGYTPPASVSYSDFDDYEQAPKEVKEALAAALPPVAVAANRTSTYDIVLSKGAIISGTVRFDDGEPASEMLVSLLRKNKTGKWVELPTEDSISMVGAATDDQGNFRLTSLPAGEYLLRTRLTIQGGQVRNGPPNSILPTFAEPDYNWDIYFGDGLRPSDAKAIKLKDGEESIGNLIEIPLAKLHSISGTVLSLETGAPVNSAHIELHNADDDSIDTSTQITTASGQFHFAYVAEGEYTLKVTHAEDVIPNAFACTGCPPSGDAKPIRTYADANQPLIVKGEMNGIAISVKPQTPAAMAPAQ